MLGRRQAARHGSLESAFVGSNPTAPAIFMPFFTLCIQLSSYFDGIGLSVLTGHLQQFLKPQFNYIADGYAEFGGATTF